VSDSGFDEAEPYEDDPITLSRPSKSSSVI
jgi:hypothetical protein